MVLLLLLLPRLWGKGAGHRHVIVALRAETFSDVTPRRAVDDLPFVDTNAGVADVTRTVFGGAQVPRGISVIVVGGGVLVRHFGKETAWKVFESVSSVRRVHGRGQPRSGPGLGMRHVTRVERHGAGRR